jgi:hypothetical protein
MGTGFAYWTDLINLKATAVTGELDVNFTAAAPEGNNFEGLVGGLANETAYHTVTPTATFNANDPDNVSVKIENIYPGYYQQFSATAANSGTVAAKLGKITFTNSDVTNAATANMIGVQLIATSSYMTPAIPGVGPQYNKIYTGKCYEYNRYGTCFLCGHDGHEKIDGHNYFSGYYYGSQIIGWDTAPVLAGDAGGEVVSAINQNYTADETFTIGTKTFVRLSALDGDAVTVSEAVKNMLYLTNDSTMNFKVLVAMDPDAAGKNTTGSTSLTPASSKIDADTQGTTASVTLGLVWDQYNEGRD